MNHISDIGSRHLASYLTMRKGIGCLGLALPFILAIGGMLLNGQGNGQGIRSSISAYYHTGMGDVFVGTICAIGIFLFAYKGYEPEDDRVGDFAFFCAVGLALFPTIPDMGDPSRGIGLILSPATLDIVEPSRAACLALGSDLLALFPSLLELCLNLKETSGSGLEKIIAVAHGVFAAGFFLTLAYFSLFLFTKSDREMTRKKRQRNIVYRACGYVILLAIALIVLGGLILYLELLPDATVRMVKSLDPLFWLESIAIVAFSVSWLVKGEAILKDET